MGFLTYFHPEKFHNSKVNFGEETTPARVVTQPTTETVFTSSVSLQTVEKISSTISLLANNESYSTTPTSLTANYTLDEIEEDILVNQTKSSSRDYLLYRAVLKTIQSEGLEGEKKL